MLWLLLGAGLTIFSFTGDAGPKVSVWLWVGAACYAAYRYRITRFTIVPTDKGNLCVIDDADGQRILEQIESHRARQFRSEYDFMPEGDSPEQHRARFKRSEEHTSELQSLMRRPYAVFCLKKKTPEYHHITD